MFFRSFTIWFTVVWCCCNLWELFFFLKFIQNIIVWKSLELFNFLFTCAPLLSSLYAVKNSEGEPSELQFSHQYKHFLLDCESHIELQRGPSVSVCGKIIWHLNRGKFKGAAANFTAIFHLKTGTFTEVLFKMALGLNNQAVVNI